MDHSGLLFYVGIAGLIATGILFLISLIVFHIWSKKILNRLNDEYD